MNPTTRIALVMMAAAAGCAPSAPDKPTWVDDVHPVVMATCARCHGVPAANGAPSTFRLDVYDDTLGPNGRTIRGAATMARYMCVRGGILNDMPPRDSYISERSRDILHNWFGADCNSGEVPPLPALGMRKTNREPTITANLANGRADTSLEVDYVVVDPDREVVSGVMLLGEMVANPACKAAGGRVELPTVPLHNGGGRASFNTATLCAGTYTVSASLTDGNPGVTVARTLGMVTVEHPTGNLAPFVELVSPRFETILNAHVAPITVEFTVHDGDGDYPAAFTLFAVQGEQRIDVTPAAATVGVAGQVGAVPASKTVTVDASKIPDGKSWRFELKVIDARMSESVVLSPYLIVSSLKADATPFRFAHSDPAKSVVQTLFNSCTDCHGNAFEPLALAPPVPPEVKPTRVGLKLDVRSYPDVAPRAMLLYRKVVQSREMPPRSALQLTLLGLGIAVDEVVTDKLRADLGTWLLAGAPECDPAASACASPEICVDVTGLGEGYGGCRIPRGAACETDTSSRAPCEPGTTCISNLCN